MPRLIDAVALQKTLYNDRRVVVFDGTRLGTRDYLIKHITVHNLIEEAPTIDAEPVRNGRWATDEEDIKWGNSLKRKYCTNCGKRPHFDKEKREFILTDYCPHCGAKMDGGQHENK